MLGVKKDASEAEVKSAWRTLVKKLHADLHKRKNEEREARLRRVNDAYEEAKRHFANNRLQ